MRDRSRSDKVDSDLPPLPMDDATWQAVSECLGLSAQQSRIVELILRDCSDKQIAELRGIAFSTLRSHLDRIHARLHSAGRTGLILHVFKLAQETKTCPNCGQ